MKTSCVYPSNFAIDTFLYNSMLLRVCLLIVVYILQILQLIHSYTTYRCRFRRSIGLCISFKFCNWYIPIQPAPIKSTLEACCVYPSNFAIDTFLYNFWTNIQRNKQVVYILQILQLIHSYTTKIAKTDCASLLCISFKFCNWYIPIQHRDTTSRLLCSCVYPSNFAIDTFLYNSCFVQSQEREVVYILQILQLIHSYTTQY